MKIRLMVVLALLSGCGGPAARETVSPEACERSRADAEAAWRRVAEVASEAARSPEGEEALVAEGALARLEAHRDALRASGREVEGDEALSLSNAMMDGIDEVSNEIQPTTRARADDAAEALLTDRGEDGSLRAAEGACEAMAQVIAEARPEAAADRARREALGELARRAARAADAYETSVALGDRRAGRARVATLPEPSDARMGSVREDAVERSRDARRACGVAPTLAAPSP